MNKEKAALRAFLIKKLTEAGWEVDETTLNALLSSVILEEGEPDEAKETRTISIKEDTDGKITAESVKLFNLMKVSYHDLMGFLIKEATILLTEDTKVKVFLSLLNLLHEFYPKLTYAFNETDAKILSAIYFLKKEAFTVTEVEEAYSNQNSDLLPSGRAERALDFFTSLKATKYLGNGQYATREKMVYER